MRWKRHEAQKRPPKIAVCYADAAVTREAADWLTQLGLCESVAVLADTPQDILWLCRRAKPDFLLIEAVPDAMERFDDPDKDIAGRCETAVHIRELLPECRVYLTCAERFRHLEPAMQKAVETELVDGYCFGALARRQLEEWLAEGRSDPAFGRTKRRKP